MESQQNMRKTGDILPRNYGVRLSMPRGMPDLYVPPSSYILAQIMLESPLEIQARIHDWAERHGEDPAKIEREFEDAVLKREETKNMLTHMRRTGSRQKHDIVLTNVRRNGRMIVSEVKSKGNEGYFEAEIALPERKRDIFIGYPGSRVHTLDNFFSDGKLKDATSVGVHLAIPEIALSIDSTSRLPCWGNMTGLYPAERTSGTPTPSLPYAINFFKPVSAMSDIERRRHELVTDLVMDYYLHGTSQYQMSINALSNQIIFGEALIAAIQDPHDRATFKVMRQKEREVSKNQLTTQQDRRYAAVTELIKNIECYLEGKGYNFSGYCREFVGTRWEDVAKRFEQPSRGPVYSVVTSDEHPPIIVKRFLGDKSDTWINSYDPVQKEHISQKLGIRYSLIDDVTRRESHVELMLPDERLKREDKEIHIPGILQEEYDSLRRKKGI